MFVAPSLFVADHMAEDGVEVYLSKFMVGTKFGSSMESNIPIGCNHADDVNIVFGPDFILDPPTSDISKEEMRTMSDNVIQAWSTFAKGE